MRVHTITIGDVNNPPQRLDALSTEMLHSIIAHKHELSWRREWKSLHRG